MSAFAALACVLAGSPLNGQSGAKNGEWPTYGGDLGSTRYAPLDQINAANFKELDIAWRFKTDKLGPRPEFNLESTPLMVNGVLYSTAGSRRAVVALDRRYRRAAVDAQRARRHARRERAAAPVRPRARVLERRQGGAHSLRHARLSPRRARREDRRPVTTFGNDGIVDLKQDDDQEIDLETGEVGSARHAGRRKGRGDRRCGAPDGRAAAFEEERQRLRPRLRRAHRQAAVDLPHDSESRASSATTPG